MPKVLFILSSHQALLNGHQTGWYAPELIHPFSEITKAGFEVEFASPKGGASIADEGSVTAYAADEAVVDFMKNKLHLTNNTKVLSQVNADDYVGVFIPGGHAPCFDLAVDPISIALIEKFFSSKKPVASVCHGPAAFHLVKHNGKSIFAGRKATCFSNEEEGMVGLLEQIPFLVETDITKNGGTYVSHTAWAADVVVDKTDGYTLITGSNPAAGTDTGIALVAALKA